MGAFLLNGETRNYSGNPQALQRNTAGRVLKFIPYERSELSNDLFLVCDRGKQHQ